MTEDFIDESTTPFVGEYQRRAARIERRYKLDVSITLFFSVLMGVFAGVNVAMWLNTHDGWSLITALLAVAVIVTWLRQDLKRWRRDRAAAYVALTQDMASDMAIQQLIDAEEDKQ